MAREFIEPGTKPHTSILELLCGSGRLSEARARELLHQGSVWQGKARIRNPETWVEVGVNAPLVSVWHTQYPIHEFVLDPATIVYMDEKMLAVWKPAGVNTAQSVYSDYDCLTWGLDRYLESLGQTYRINTINRLDRDTQGLVIYGRDKQSEQQLNKAFMGRKVSKQYLVLTPTFSNPPQRLHCQDTFEYEGKVVPAETHIRRICILQEGILWLAMPVTGRTHQIRKHFQRYLVPIMGDRVYGGVEDSTLRLACVGYRIPHPDGKRRVKIRALPSWDGGFVRP